MPTYKGYIRDNSGAIDTPLWRPIGVSGGTTYTIEGSGDAGNGLPVGGTVGQYLRKLSSTNYAAEWATPPGGGGGAVCHVPLTFSFDAGTIVSSTQYPDYSVPGLTTNERVMMLSTASPYTVGAWKKIHVVLTNVQTTPASSVTFQWYSLTGAGSVFSATCSGAPNATFHTLTASTTSASIASSASGDFLQLRCTAAPAGNAYGAFVIVTYELG